MVSTGVAVWIEETTVRSQPGCENIDSLVGKIAEFNIIGEKF